MAFDPSIIMGYRGMGELPNPMNQLAQVSQIQAAQQQRQMNALKMQEAQSAAEERNALRQLNPASADYENQLFKVSPQLGISYRKDKTAAEASEAVRQKNLVETAAAKSKFNSQMLRDISGRPSDANVNAYLEDIQASAIHNDAEKAKAKTAVEDLLKLPFEERKTYLAAQGAQPKELMDLYASKPVERSDGQSKWLEESNPRLPTFGQRVREAIPEQVTPGQASTAATALAGQKVTMRGQDLVNARAKENIDIHKETQRREADPAFQQTMSQARALGTNMAKDKVLRETQLPKVIDTATMTLNEIDALIGKRDEKGTLLKGQAPHPGFETAVGASWLPGARFIPGTSAADFQSRFDQIKGGAFLQAFETLKGGGSITNIEGEKGTSALNRMQLAQSEKEFVTAAKEFQSIIKTGVERAKKLAGAPSASTSASPHAEKTDAQIKEELGL